MKRIITTLAILFTLILALTITIALSAPVKASSISNNPWGYSFDATGGSRITSPNQAFCNYFQCISIKAFWSGKGYVVQCTDGKFSKSGGRPGSCSRNGGEGQILYAHTSSVTPQSPSQPASNPPASSGQSTTTSPTLPLTGSDPYTTH